MQNRENFMLKLQEFKTHLYYDRVTEALESLRQALGLYEKPEIYNMFDIELIHFIIHLDDTLTFEKRSRILKEVKELLNDFKDKNPEIIPLWLSDIVGLTLASFPNSGDPRDVISLRNLIDKHPTSVELRFALALGLVQDSIEKENEGGFKECLSLFMNLAPLFSKKEERASRFRTYFPINPENLFIRLRMWALFQYSEFLQNHDRDDEAIQLLKAQASEAWIRLAGENEKTQLQMEIKILERGQRITESIGSKYEEKFKHSMALLIGLPFFASMMGGILAGSHLTYSETAKLIFEIALLTLLIISISLLLLGSNKRQRTFPIITSTALLLALFCFVAPDSAANLLLNVRNATEIPGDVSMDNASPKLKDSTSSQHSIISDDTLTDSNSPL